MPRPHRSSAGTALTATGFTVSGALLPRPHRSVLTPSLHDRVLAMFPGLYCPGLIEAPTSQRQPTHGEARFRGSIAPASSKHTRPRPCRPRTRHSFRGSIAPASSKRVGAMWMMNDATQGFRGSIAPASSKPAGDVAHLAPLPGFRGSIAPASSKLGRILGAPHGVLPFPGLYCPGLIEAPRSRCWPPSGAQVSGALLPRPHRSEGGRVDV